MRYKGGGVNGDVDLSRATILYLVFSHAFVYVWFDGGGGVFFIIIFLVQAIRAMGV